MTSKSRDRWGTVARHSATALCASAVALFARGEASGRDLQRLDDVVAISATHGKSIAAEHDAVIGMQKDVALLLKGQDATLAELHALREQVSKIKGN